MSIDFPLQDCSVDVPEMLQDRHIYPTPRVLTPTLASFPCLSDSACNPMLSLSCVPPVNEMNLDGIFFSYAVSTAR